MEKDKIKENLKKAIAELLEKDWWLLQQDLNERSISHRLALYLETLFPDYEVDCEYNGDVTEGNYGRKRIKFLREKLDELHKLTIRERGYDEEIISKTVYPDIVIHKRGCNERNLFIVEIKKSTNKRPEEREFDLEKLSAYTSDYWGNHLRYEIGIFIDFATRDSFKKGCFEENFELEFFQDGNKSN
jgi:hypothetical protein